jgi:hypothetical protein
VINEESKNKYSSSIFANDRGRQREKWLTFIKEKTAEHVRLHLIPIED